MPQSHQGQGFANYGTVVWRYRWLIVACAAVATIASLALDFTSTKTYTATAQMQLLSQNVTDRGATVPLSPTDIATSVNIVTSQAVQDLVSEQLHRTAPDATASQVGATSVVQVSVASHQKAFAAKVANLYANSYVAYTTQRFSDQVSSQEKILLSEKASLESQINIIEAQLAKTQTSSPTALSLNIQLQNASSALQTAMLSLTNLQLSLQQASAGAQITSSAMIPKSPSSPKPFTDAAVLGILGLMIGLAAAFSLNYFDDRIRTREQITKVLAPIPFLGDIPKFKSWPEDQPYAILCFERPNSPEAEAYRGLRTSIEFLAQETRGGKIIQVTSPNENEGKSTTAVNLATTIAMGGRKVILVGGDLRRPQLHHYFGISNDIGFSSVLSGTSTLDEALVRVELIPNLMVMPGGPIPPNPSELLGSNRAEDIWATLGQMADFVIVDSPPVLPVTDAVVIARTMDAIVFVANAESTRAREALVASERIAAIGSTVSGSVLNGVAHPNERYRYRYRYGYSYGYASRRPYESSVAAVQSPKTKRNVLKAGRVDRKTRT